MPVDAMLVVGSEGEASARPYLSTANASYVLANTALPGPLMFQRQQLSLCIPGSCNTDKVHPLTEFAQADGICAYQ